MAKTPDIYRLSQGVPEEKTKNAIGQLERLLREAFSRIADLEARIKQLETP